MPPPSRRRWYQFSLRGLLVAVTLLCLWLGWAMNWIRQRREFLARPNVVIGTLPDSANSPRAPYALWLLGERGRYLLSVDDRDDPGSRELARELFPEAKFPGIPWPLIPAHESHKEQARALFPEAHLVVFPDMP